ncbi:MAG: toll/interleukin-1 receptor domain-containing protein, partial [Planctomycetes bacterium]|nr:toll/interleukin-1 receptor domain-containing protein [Planctomycetota bacterium]
MAVEVFISYASRDRQLAEIACAQLEAAGMKCWIAPRDLQAGETWSEAIVKAVEASRVAVVIVSADTLESRHVAREVERADSKGKDIIPFVLDNVLLEGALAYYLGAIQALHAQRDREETGLRSLVREVQDSLQRRGRWAKADKSRQASLTDDDLLALARAICWDVREELAAPVDPEAAVTISEPEPGQQVKLIDMACNRRARRVVSQWESRHGHSVWLAGEDLEEVAPPPDRRPVLCCLDSLDGTQYWLRSKKIYCTAISIFLRGPGVEDPYRLRVSMVQNADGVVFLAREDKEAAFIDGSESPLSVPASPVRDVAEAHVSTVCRRPAHYQVLAPLLARACPFAGLYTFG